MLAPAHAARPSCRLCGAPLRRHLRRPRHVAALRELPHRASSSTRWSRSTRCTSGSARTACSSSSRPTSRPRRSSATTRTSPRTPTAGSSTRARYTELIVERLRPRRDSLVVELASNDGYLLQHFVARGIPALGIEPAANVAEAAASAASRRSSSSSTRRSPGQLVADGPPADSHRRQQRPRAGARAERLRRRDRDPARAGRRRDDRVAAPRAPDRGAPVRHDLPRALLVLLADDARRGSPPTTGSRSSTSRSCRPTAARCASTCSTRATTATSRRQRRARPRPRASAAATTQLDGYRGFARRVDEVKWQLLELLIGLTARREAGRRLRRAGQGQHAAQLLRHPRRSSRLHGRPQPPQAREVPARHAHPDPSARADRGDAARLHPDPALEPQARDRRAARVRPGLGRAADRPDSAPRGLA